MRRLSSHRLGLQLRGAAAAAPKFPQDPPPPLHDRSKASAKMTPPERMYFKLGPTNEYPGHEYSMNRFDIDAPPLPDPITGYIPQISHAPAPEFEFKASIPSGLNTVQKDLHQLRRNPPVNIQDDISSDRYRKGMHLDYFGGSLDGPYRLLVLNVLHGFVNDKLFYVRESVDGIVQNVVDSAKVEKNVLFQPLEDTPAKRQVFQVPFTKKREEQGFRRLPLIAEAKESDSRQPGRLEQELTWHFDTTPLGFAVDGVAGSCRDDEVRCRVFTDNTAHALFWTHLLHNLPSQDYSNLIVYRPPILIWHAPGYTFENEKVVEEFGGPRKSDLGLEHEKFVLVDPYCKPATALIAGDISLDVARDVLAYLVAVVQFEELDVLTIPGDAVIAEDGTVTVYIGSAGKHRNSPNLYGAHHLTLSPDGLGRTWKAVTRDADPKNFRPYDLVTTIAGKQQHTHPLTTRLNDESSRPKPYSPHKEGFFNRKYPVSYDSVDPLESLRMDDGTQKTKKKPQTMIRPNLVPLEKVKVVFTRAGEKARAIKGDEAAKLFVEAVTKWGYPYAPEEELIKAFTATVEGGVSCSVAA